MMNEPTFLLQNQFDEISISLERVRHLHCTAAWRGDRIIPPFSSIGLIMEGRGTMVCDAVTMHPSKGQLYLLPTQSTQSFCTDPQSPYEKYFCHFHIKCHGVNFFELIHAPLCVHAGDSKAAEELFQKLLAASQQTSLQAFLQVKQYTLDLLMYYLECCGPDSISFVRHTFDSPISSAIAYVEDSLDQPISVQKMAEIAGYHPSHFTKLFQKRLGMTPAQFVIKKKTEHAMEALTSTTCSISDIAESLGFGNPFYFSNFFKKQTGMTPSEYRNAYKRNGL